MHDIISMFYIVLSYLCCGLGLVLQNLPFEKKQLRCITNGLGNCTPQRETQPQPFFLPGQQSVDSTHRRHPSVSLPASVDGLVKYTLQLKSQFLCSLKCKRHESMYTHVYYIIIYNYQYIHNNMFISWRTIHCKHGFSFLLQPLRFSNIIQRQVRSGYSKPNGTALMTNIPWQAGVMK